MYEATDVRVVCVEDAASGIHDQGRRELDGVGVVRMTAAALAESVACAAAEG